MHIRPVRTVLGRSVLGLGVLASAIGAARAQSFNIDVGAATGNPVPLASFGAGAGQFGSWTIAPVTNGVPTALADVNGSATAVTSTCSGGANYANINNLGGATVNDLNLMSDIHDPGGLTRTWTFTNLAAGEYDLYTYAMAPDVAAFLTDVSVSGSTDPLQSVGGPWPNAYVQGTTHARHHVSVSAGVPVVVTIAPTPPPMGIPGNAASVNGFQIVRLDASGTPFCFGDGLDTSHTTACPCGNTGGPGRGCASSVNPAGALLTASGAPNPDTLVLSASGMPVSAAAIYLQGDQLDDAVFGDGVRCNGGSLIRLRARVSTGGASQFPDSTDTVSLSVRGGVTPGSGAVRFYSTYYRNAAAAFCPPDTFNVTNGWRLTW